MKKFFEAIGFLVISLFVLIFVAVIYGLFVMWLWNFIAPVFGLPVLTFVQAYALTLLCSILFKSSSSKSSDK